MLTRKKLDKLIELIRLYESATDPDEKQEIWDTMNEVLYRNPDDLVAIPVDQM